MKRWPSRVPRPHRRENWLFLGGIGADVVLLAGLGYHFWGLDWVFRALVTYVVVLGYIWLTIFIEDR